MKRLSYFFIVVLILINLLFIQSCKKDENPVIPPEETTKIPATTKYISPADYANYFEGFSTDSTQLLFKTDINSTYNFKSNDVIAISEGSGLLRKVTGTQTTNNQLIVSTIQGTLEDAIENGTIEYSGPLSKKNLLKVEILTDGIEYDNRLNKTNETQYDFNIVNKVLYDADNNLSTTNDQIRLNGVFSFTSDIFVKILVKNFKLQYAKYGFEAHNSESLTLDAMIQYNLSKEIEIARITMTPITVQVGILPVIIVPDLRIKIGVSGYANAGISTSIQNEFHFEAGSEFIIGIGWQPYKTFTNNFNYNPPSLTANCGARAYIKPEINMAVYGVLAGYGYGEAYGKLEADLLQNPWWKLYVGYNLGIGARAEILGHGLFDFVLDGLIQNEVLIAQATNQTNTAPSASFTINPSSGTTDTLFQFNASTSSDLQDPPSLLQVRWDWEGDGIWDTEYSTTKTVTHQYSVDGNYNPKLEVKDSGGLIDTESKSLVVLSSGTIPQPPVLSSPINGATDVIENPTLRWNASTGATSYSLQVSTSSSFTSYIYNADVGYVTSKLISGLNNSSTYYWRVKASNSYGTSDPSTVWVFTIQSSGIIPAEGLVAHYPLDQNANDYSIYNNDGTPFGNITWVTDRKNNPASACNFDGTNSYIEIPNSASIQINTNKLTFALWFYCTGTPQGPAAFFSKTDDPDIAQYTFHLNPFSIIRFGITDTSNVLRYISHSYPFSYNQWYFIAATWDGITVKIFVNDSLVTAQPFVYIMKSDNNPLEIGKETGGLTEWYQGKLDAIRIYNRALSENEIIQLFNE
jgi:hypothetical protein